MHPSFCQNIAWPHNKILSDMWHWFSIDFFLFQERRRNSPANETCYRIAAADQRHLFVVIFVRFQKSFKSWRIDSRRRRKSISTFFYHRGRAFEVILTTSNQLTHLCSLVDNAFELENIYLSHIWRSVVCSVVSLFTGCPALLGGHGMPGRVLVAKV